MPSTLVLLLIYIYTDYALSLLLSYAVALSSLNSVISHPNALQPDHVMVHDVAVSALGKICYFHYDNIKEAEVLTFSSLYLY